MLIRPIMGAIIFLQLSACSAPTPREATRGHLNADSTGPASNGDIPAPVDQMQALPRPRSTAKTESYSVVVNKVDIHDLLFALARDAKINVDIHPGITGKVTLNAIEQTLPQLLARIARQVDLRFEFDGSVLAVMPDIPFLKNYRVDYVNLSRNVSGTISANTQISTGVTGSAATATNSPGGGSGNVSNTRIENASKNLFWESLEKNIKDILRETDKILPEGSSETMVEQANTQNATGAAALPQGSGQRAAQSIASALATNPLPSSTAQGTGSTTIRRSTFREAASVIVNPEAGIVAVRATQRQHEKIQEFIDRVLASALRQVMIEATIVEVRLSDAYEQGIDWTRLIGSGIFRLSPVAGILSSGATPTMSYSGNTVTKADLRLLETFGEVRVLSSPRLSVLNNQTALLKVVENIVYFNIKSDTTVTTNVGTNIAVTTTPQSVSVGLVMTVTPQVGETDSVTLNVRPTISSVSGFKDDPNPTIPAGLKNQVPQIRTREIESVMRVASGEIAVLGGLMEDGVDYQTGRIPGLGLLPVVGEVVTTRNNSASKSELVIFLRPVVIKNPSLDGDYAGLRNHLPRADFFTLPPQARPFTAAGSPMAATAPMPQHQRSIETLASAAVGSEPIRLLPATHDIDAPLARAYDKLRSGQLEAARGEYEQVLQDDPWHVDALLGLAAIARREGRPGAAESHVRRAVEAHPRDGNAQAVNIEISAGVDPVAAESRLKALLAEQPQSPALNFSLGNVHALQERWAEAQPAYFQAIAADGDNPDYLFNLAVSLEHLRQPRLAARHYRQALEAAERRPAAFDRGRAKQRLEALQP